MSHWITLVTPHGRINGWAAEPDDKPNGGVVIVPDIFGVNADMIRIASHHADDGYLTVVPAVFDKIKRDVEQDDYSDENRRVGQEIAERLGLATAVELVHCTVDAIAHAGKVAIIGYGWGSKVASCAARSLNLPWVGYTDDTVTLPVASTNPALLHSGAANPQSESGVTFQHTRDFLRTHIRHEND